MDRAPPPLRLTSPTLGGARSEVIVLVAFGADDDGQCGVGAMKRARSDSSLSGSGDLGRARHAGEAEGGGLLSADRRGSLAQEAPAAGRRSPVLAARHARAAAREGRASRSAAALGTTVLGVYVPVAVRVPLAKPAIREEGVATPGTDPAEDKAADAAEARAVAAAASAADALALDAGGAAKGGPAVPRPFTTKRVFVHRLSCGSRHTLAVVGSKVYSWGWGLRGQLGHGDSSSVSTPRVVAALADSDVLDVAAGGCHSAVVTSTGHLYTMGDNLYGQQGRGSVKAVGAKSSLPRRVDFPADAGADPSDAAEVASGAGAVPAPFVAAVNCGGMHTLVTLTNGKLYAFGRGDNGQLGVGAVSRFLSNPGQMGIDTPTQVQVPDGERVRSLSCGGFHSAFVCQSGALFTFGKPDYGMLGHPEKNEEHSPRRVEALTGRRIRAVSCGGWHTVAIDDDGTTWAFGRGEYGRLGSGSDRSVALPTVITELEGLPIRNASCGGTHSLFRNGDGTVWSCGRAEGGRLGHGSMDTLLYPTPIDEVDLVVAADHALQNSHGADKGSPGKHVESVHVQALSAGGAHSVVMLKATVVDDE